MSTPKLAELTMSVMFPSEFLACPDLKGKTPTVTITNVSMDMVQMEAGGKEQKPVLRFHGTKKKLLCGKTNGHALALLFGDAAENWLGKKIVLCPDVTTFGKKDGSDDRGCIRILSSPDATKERSEAYAKAWRGDRKGGALASRLKRARALLSATGAGVPPVTPVDPEYAERQAAEESGDASVSVEPDMFASDDAPANPPEQPEKAA